MSRLAVLAALVLVTLTSCFSNSFEVAHSKLLVRYVPSEDALLVLEIESGLQGTEDRGVNELVALAAGARIYPASGTWFASDIDKVPTDQLSEGELTQLDEFRAAVHVQEHGLFLENERTLSYYRLTRIEHVRRMLEIANASVNRSLGDQARRERVFEANFPLYDRASWDLFRSAVIAEHRWVTVEGASIVLDYPMTTTNAARCLAWIAQQQDKRDELQFFEKLSSLEIDDGHARLSFGDEQNPVVTFDFANELEGASESLIRRLRDAGAKFGASTAAQGAIQKFETAPSAK